MYNIELAKRWRIRDHVYVVVTACILCGISGLFGVLSFLYATPLFFIADFVYTYPHVLLMVLCALIVRKFPVCTYVSIIEGILSGLILGWGFLWLPIYLIQGLVMDLYLRSTRAYDYPKLIHYTIAGTLYTIIVYCLTWFMFLYVLGMRYPLYLICGSFACGLTFGILGALSGFRIAPKVIEALVR